MLMNIFADIETVPRGLWSDLVEVPQWDDFKVEPKAVSSRFKDPEVIAKAEAKNKKDAEVEQSIAHTKAMQAYEKEVRDMSLMSGRCQIISIAISLQYKDIHVITDTDEEALMKEFERIVIGIHQKYKDHSFRWVGHNILNFDLPILERKRLMYGLRQLSLPWDESPYRRTNVYDTFHHIPYTNKDKRSLDAILQEFGISEGKPDFDGSMIYDAYNDGELDRIKEYQLKEMEDLKRLCFEKLRIHEVF